jgi:large subunit ribosomal protein L7/L12
MADLKDFAEQLVNLTVKEVNELADILKDEYGIEPAAAAVAVAAGPATATAAAAGSIPYSSFKIVANSLTSFTVKLTNCSAKSFKSAILIVFKILFYYSLFVRLIIFQIRS